MFDPCKCGLLPAALVAEARRTAAGVLRQLAAGPLAAALAAGGRPQTVDRYGRTVAEVYAGGRNVGVEMIRQGMAYVYREYLSGCDANTYLSAEEQAQRFRQGVWQWGNEVKPWDFRRSR